MKSNGLIDNDESALSELLKMSESELLNVSFDHKKWTCCIEGCYHSTTIKDYGVLPLFRWRKKWLNLDDNLFYCGKHWKIFKQQLNNLPYKELEKLNILTDTHPTKGKSDNL